METRERFQAQAERGEALGTGLTDDQLNACPDADTWSLGMQLDHIAISLEKAVGEMEKALEQGIPPGDPNDWKPNLLERKFIEAVGGVPGRTVPVPRGFEPRETRLERESLIDRYTHAHERIIAVIERTKEADLKKIQVHSAALPILKLSLGAWLAAMAAHTDYHLEKAERLRKTL